MDFHVFGEKNSPTIILIHGMLTPWQIWSEYAEKLSEKYYVVCVELDAHSEKTATEFLSIEDEAKTIAHYIQEELCGKVYAVCGLSLGGAIAFELWKSNSVSIEKLIMDGAPIIPSGSFATFFMTRSYLNIIHKSKRRDPKTLQSFKKNFLPEKYLVSYLDIADNMSDQSVRNILRSINCDRIVSLPESDTDILFIHGTKGNEVLSKKAAKKLKQMYKYTQTYCCDGCAHCYYAIYEPQKWLEIVNGFLQKQ